MSETKAAAVYAKAPTLALGLACVLGPLNATLIAAGLADIARSFDAPLSDVTWMVSIYLALAGSLQVLTGAIGDRIGAVTAVRVGLIGMAASSLLAAAAPTIVAATAARASQALFSALIVPNAIALVREHAPVDQRGRAIGLLGAMMGVGAGLGLPLGGIIVWAVGWRGLFLFSAPVAVMAFFQVAKHVKVVGGSSEPVSVISYLGLAMLPLAMGLECVHRPGLVAVGVALLVGAAALLLAVVLRIRAARELAEARAALFRGPMAYALVFIVMQQVVFFSLTYMLPVWLHGTLQVSTGVAAGIAGLMPLIVVMLSPMAGRISDDRGPRGPAAAGAALSVLGLVGLGLLTPSVATVGVGIVVLGVGAALSGPSVARIMLDRAPPQAAGLTMGLSTAAQYLGRIVGAAMLSVGLAERAKDLSASEGQSILMHLAIVATVGFWCTARLPTKQTDAVTEAQPVSGS